MSMLYYVTCNSRKEIETEYFKWNISDAAGEFLYRLYARIIFNSTSTRNYTLCQFTFTSLNKDARSMPSVCVQVPTDYIVLFPLRFPPALLFPRSATIKDRSHVSRVGCRSSSDHHVSADFPIKPAEQLSIGGNQRLLSACSAILPRRRDSNWALHDRVRLC